MTTYADVAPPDKADSNPLDEAFRAMIRALASTNQPKPTVTVRLRRDEWDRARTYYQRPYRGRPSEFGIYLDCGTVWVEPDEPVIITVPAGTIPEKLDLRPGSLVVMDRTTAPGDLCPHCHMPDGAPGACHLGATVIETACPSSPIIVPPLRVDRDAVDARSAEVASVTLGSTNASTGVTADYGGVWRENK